MNTAKRCSTTHAIMRQPIALRARKEECSRLGSVRYQRKLSSPWEAIRGNPWISKRTLPIRIQAHAIKPSHMGRRLVACAFLPRGIPDGPP